MFARCPTNIIALPVFEIARVLVRFDHGARCIVNANHSVIYTGAGQTQRTKTL